MIPEVGRVPSIGLQERVLSLGGRKVVELEHGWAETELGQFKEKAQGLEMRLAQ